MEIERRDGDSLVIRVSGPEWDALEIPVIRTNDAPHPHRHPRSGWPRWPRFEAPGRAEVVLLIRSQMRTEASQSGMVEIALPNEYVGGLVQVLKQNRRVAGNVQLVPDELIDQMVSAIRAAAEGNPIPRVETGRIASEFAAAQDVAWERRRWQIGAFGLTRRRARTAIAVLRLLRLGDFVALDPREWLTMHVDYCTAVGLRPILTSQDAGAVLADDLDEFLAHANPPEPD